MKNEPMKNSGESFIIHEGQAGFFCLKKNGGKNVKGKTRERITIKLIVK